MRPGLLVVLAAAVLLAGTAGAAAIGGGAGVNGVGSVATARGDLQQVGPPQNATPVRHVDPDRTEPVEYGRIEGWLGLALSGRLAGSSAELARGDYERARALLGDDVDRYLAQYAEVAAETPGGTDDRVAAEFAAAAATQRNLTDRVAAFERTLADYRDARRAGDEARARRLARDIVAEAARIDRAGEALAGSYRALENDTGREFDPELAAVDAVAANATGTGERVAEESLVRTAVRIESAQARAAFDDPLAVRGSVVDEDGSPVARGRLRLSVGGRTLATGRSDPSGAFSLAGRPTLVLAGNRTATVEYVPAADSVHLGAAATTAVRVDPMTPTVDVTVEPQSARFGDFPLVAGRVHVGGRPVAGVPVDVAVGDARALRVETGEDGVYVGSFRLPADVEPGDRRVSATLATDGLAVGPATATTPLSVGVRSTRLALAVGRTGPDAARVEAALVAEDGRPVPGRSITLEVGDGTAITGTTDRAGRFVATVPAGLERTPVVARFDATGTNLRPANASAPLPAAAAPGADPPSGVPSGLTAAGIIGLLALAAGYAAFRRRREAGAGVQEVDGPAGADDEPSAPAAALLARARAGLRAGRPDLAVRIAYGAARERLGRDVEGQGTATHWEFYRTCAERLDEDGDAALRSVTEAFERAAFSRAGADRETATRAIEAAGRLVDAG